MEGSRMMGENYMRINSITPVTCELVEIDGNKFKRYANTAWTCIYSGIEHKLNDDSTEMFENMYQKFLEGK